MIRAVEVAYGKLQDAETPSNEYLAVKVEECENNEPLAAMLDEVTVTSKLDATTASLQSSLGSSGHIRVVKTKNKGRLPESSEDLRTT